MIIIFVLQETGKPPDKVKHYDKKSFLFLTF